MVILVDTNILIDYFRQKDKRLTVFNKTFNGNSNRSAAICLTTVSELWSGNSMEDKNNRALTEQFLSSIRIVKNNIETSKITGELMREKKDGISFQDAEIAACALYHKLPLLTLNQKDFRKIKGIKLLPI